MTAEEKASSLVVMFYGHTITVASAINCALLAVEQIISETLSEYTNDENHDRVEFWKNVKKEIKKL